MGAETDKSDVEEVDDREAEVESPRMDDDDAVVAVAPDEDGDEEEQVCEEEVVGDVVNADDDDESAFLVSPLPAPAAPPLPSVASAPSALEARNTAFLITIRSLVSGERLSIDTESRRSTSLPPSNSRLNHSLSILSVSALSDLLHCAMVQCGLKGLVGKAIHGNAFSMSCRNRCSACVEDLSGCRWMV